MGRRYTQFEDRRVGADDGSSPSPGLGSKKQPKFDRESTAAWPGAPGQKGPDLNRRVKYAKVKKSAKEDM